LQKNSSIVAINTRSYITQFSWSFDWLQQTWTWVGFTHGLGWVGLGW